ncbi:MAG: sensor histidine kinase [Symbiobacteriia bacterium]
MYHSGKGGLIIAAQHKSDLEDLFAASKRALDEGRAQPHFLFNALNTITHLIDAERYADANRTVLALATLLRYGFHPPDGLMSLGEELRVVEAYTTIQKIRFRDRVAVGVAVSPEVARARIPPFIVQAMVENAFVHGIEAKPGPGRVTVKATVHENRLMITVTDDGVGKGELSAELHAVHRRLGDLFGPGASLTSAAGDDGGTVACLTLPMQSEEV